MENENKKGGGLLNNTSKEYGTFDFEEEIIDENESLLENLNKDQIAVRKVGYDDILREIGEFGPWQQWLAALFWIPPAVSGAVFMLGSFTSKNQ